MSKIYDNWEKLVVAVIRREKDRQLVYCESFSTYSTDFSSRFSSKFAEVSISPEKNFNDSDLSSPNIFSCRNVKAIEYEEIGKATRNFRPSNMLLGGPYVCVYKGWIDEHYAAVKPGFGIPVAVKILNNTTNLQLEKWVDEIYSLSHLRHPNLLTPIGYSFDKDSRILVYEFLPKGSLDNHLFRGGWRQLFSWATRIKVAIGTARGLAFLHSLEKPIISRCLTSVNIVLDSDFNAKLSGIGLRGTIYKLQGPFGFVNDVSHTPYAAPEFIHTGNLSTGCDVYSFGVVLIELITGRQVVDRYQLAREINLIHGARPYLGNKTKLSQIMDRRLGQYSYKQACTIAQLSLLCLSSDARARRGMDEVVDVLQEL